MMHRQVTSVVDVRPDALDYHLPATTSHPGAGPATAAVLLSHGYSSSPASVLPWAEYLASRGYDVSAPRLPGHGTTWREMNMTAWTDWYYRLEQEYLRLAADHEVVMVGGQSMGGCLAIRLAQQHPEIPAVVLVNPSIATYDRRYRLLLPWLQYLKPSFPAISGDINKPGIREYAYDCSPLRAAWSMTRMWQVVTATMDRFTAPTLLFRSTVDHVVDYASVDLLRRLPNVTVRMLEDSYHVACLDNDAERLAAESADFFDRFRSAGA